LVNEWNYHSCSPLAVTDFSNNSLFHFMFPLIFTQSNLSSSIPFWFLWSALHFRVPYFTLLLRPLSFILLHHYAGRLLSNQSQQSAKFTSVFIVFLCNLSVLLKQVATFQILLKHHHNFNILNLTHILGSLLNSHSS
jgi:hypothetical protein